MLSPPARRARGRPFPASACWLHRGRAAPAPSGSCGDVGAKVEERPASCLVLRASQEALASVVHTTVRALLPITEAATDTPFVHPRAVSRAPLAWDKGTWPCIRRPQSKCPLGLGAQWVLRAPASLSARPCRVTYAASIFPGGDWARWHRPVHPSPRQRSEPRVEPRLG